MAARRSKLMLEALSVVAPGRPLREGLDRIIKANMGALIVIGDGDEVQSICSGGFKLDAAFSPQRLSELAKTDGAIILAPDTTRIAWANVHLMPNPNTPTTETGTRHRTAERVARSIGVPVISVSEDMAVLTVYMNDVKHQLEPIRATLSRSSQAIQTLERYKVRLNDVATSLARLEVEDLVTVSDVVALLQRTEIVVRIAEEIERYLVELGSDGRLIRLQLQELMAGVENERRLVVRDYVEMDPSWNLESAMATLSEFEMEQLLDTAEVAKALHLSETSEADDSLTPKGYRMLSKVQRLGPSEVDRIVERFGNLDKVLRSDTDELASVSGVGEANALNIKKSLEQMTESSILDQYR